MTLIRLRIKSNSDRIACTDAHAASTRSHSSSRRFLLTRVLVNVQARATVERFPYQGRYVQYLKHAAVHYPAEMYGFAEFE
ncbi:hypothetical protein TNCV_3131121 [Trichonephila clavipes]|nr:hypothetical protein TNCV_3131121 [Trichonephila clavipes]